MNPADLDFSTIQTEDEVKNHTQLVSMMIFELSSRDQKAHKQAISNLLAKINQEIIDPTSTGNSKLMALLMLRDFTQRHAVGQRKEDKNSKLFSHLASHPILTELRRFAEETDPFKQIHEKGKSLFSDSSVNGNNFIRLVLELIRFWAVRFPNTSKKEPTTYKKIYDQLDKKKVIFPTEYKYLAAANGKKAQKNDPSIESARVTRLSNKQETPVPASTGRSTTKAEINRMHGKILNFVEMLDEDLGQLEPEIRKIHQVCTSDLKKYQKMTEQVVQMGESDPQIVSKFFAIMDFMQKETTHHQQYISKSNDYQSYVLALKLDCQQLLKSNSNSKKFPSGPPLSSNPRNSHQNKQPLGKIDQPEQSKKPVIDQAALNAVSNYFTRLEQRSKSPIAAGGFKKINQSLSKDKASSIKRSISPINRSKINVSKSLASLKESKISPIFSNPPNRNPPAKTYEGRSILQNNAIYFILQSITKNQGLRRFKSSNFKVKSSLFENQHIQIGYKSESISEEVSGFKVLIKLELFFGNLSDERIQDLSVEFKGDQNILVYANPRTIQPTISKGDQNRLDLMVVPLKVPFPLLVAIAKYRVKGEVSEQRVVLPSSVLKLANFMSIPRQQFSRRWSGAYILKTSEFRLCHYVPPDSLTKWIPQLTQLTSYTAFASAGSTKDYELECAVIMLRHYQALLKINVRPNLDVVLQLGVEDKNEQAVQYFTYFLQTLQQLIRQVIV